MLEKLLDFNKAHKLFCLSEKILVGVSGGIDSVVLCDLLKKAGAKFGIGHCNFNLRGDDSLSDEVFVEKLAENYLVPFHSINFNTQEYAAQKGISIQMAARELRYSWFCELCFEHGYQKIVTAHHANDNIETFFINLIRGTGISGLHGILPVNNKIIRPLLFAYKDEIVEYASINKIDYREDTSNVNVKYLRNYIRHNIIPAFNIINPVFPKTMQMNTERIQQAESLYHIQINRVKRKVMHKKNGDIFIAFKRLKSYGNTEAYLFEFLQEFGFNPMQIKDIISSFDDISGKQFFSDTHRLLKDRDQLIVYQLDPNHLTKFGEVFLIDNNSTSIETPVKLKFEWVENSKKTSFSGKQEIAYFDSSKIEFPLIIRKWRRGDYFYPFGMTKKKKLSDFFINNKFTIKEKEDCWLLCSGEKIIWLIGHRADNRFRVLPSTKQIFKVELNRN